MQETFFDNLTTGTIITSIIDIAIVWYVFYLMFAVMRGTKAIQLIKGIFLILIGRLVSNFFNLTATTAIFDTVLEWGFLAIIVIFQPELRRALEQLGRGSLFKGSSSTTKVTTEKLHKDVLRAVQYMAKRRIGALIVFEKETGLQDYIETGTRVDANISSELLINIFMPNAPLHDGAMIIQTDKVTTAASYLPLSDSNVIAKNLGTRHRAAVGISEVTDAFTIVISEETGHVSVTHGGKLYQALSPDELEESLIKNWTSIQDIKEGGGLFARK